MGTLFFFPTYLLTAISYSDDWTKFTDYRGYEMNDEVIQWFWKCVRSWPPERKSRLLQFVTGTRFVGVEILIWICPDALLIAVFLSMASKTCKEVTVLEDSQLRSLVIPRSCPRVIRASTVSTCHLTKIMQAWSKN